MEGGVLVPAARTPRTWWLQLLESLPGREQGCLLSSQLHLGLWLMPRACPEGKNVASSSICRLAATSAFCVRLSCRIAFEKRLPLLYERFKITLLIYLPNSKLCFSISFLLEDELTGILKKLSLEKYQPIFEEQEVRMFFLSVGLNFGVKKKLSKYVAFHSAGLD